MNEQRVREMLAAVQAGTVSVDQALDRLRAVETWVAESELTLDLHRELRRGTPEAVFAAGKSEPQLMEAVERLLADPERAVLVTRLAPEMGGALAKRFAELTWDADAGCAFRMGEGKAPEDRPRVLVVSAGASDRRVAREALVTARVYGADAGLVQDVGVAGLHRLLNHGSALREAAALVVVAGMEGALPSVVAGLVQAPVIAVPTSVGYGAAFGGIAALLAMLTSCSPGIAAVNIDNGFGAGYLAAQIARRRT